MPQYLGRLMTGDRQGPPWVRYLSKAEGEAVRRDGRLGAVDAQGATFETEIDAARIAESLPWGSIAAVRFALGDER